MILFFCSTVMTKFWYYEQSLHIQISFTCKVATHQLMFCHPESHEFYYGGLKGACKVAASLMLTSETFLTALEHNGCIVLVITRNAFAFGFASTLTRHPTSYYCCLSPLHRVEMSLPRTQSRVRVRVRVSRPNFTPFMTATQSCRPCQFLTVVVASLLDTHDLGPQVELKTLTPFHECSWVKIDRLHKARCLQGVDEEDNHAVPPLTT